MTLDVPIPEPPDLSNRGRPRGFEWDESEPLGSEDFYREDLENLLQEGAWREGFEEWAEFTDLDEEEVRIVDALDLFQAFDFYRDPKDDHLRFDAPTVPEDWREGDVAESLDSSSVSAINGELHELGRAVHETLQDYLGRTRASSDREEELFGEREEESEGTAALLLSTWLSYRGLWQMINRDEMSKRIVKRSASVSGK